MKPSETGLPSGLLGYFWGRKSESSRDNIRLSARQRDNSRINLRLKGEKMSPHVIYKHPTVKKVIFQIRFPNLFFMENIVPDLQRDIMTMFPESSLAIRKQFVLADVGSAWKKQDLPEELQELETAKIWQFKSDTGVNLNVQNNSLDMTTESHTTYHAANEPDCFRDILQFVLGYFFKWTKIQQIARVGLRYIDESPLPEVLNNDSFTEYYDTTFPLGRFSIADAKAMLTRSEVAKGDYFLTFVETLGKKKSDGSDVLVLDFDGYANNVKSDECLEVTDGLHALIHSEWESFIKNPVRTRMNRDTEAE
jgi:uncharacterized protein (TIGR04255 family)